MKKYRYTTLEGGEVRWNYPEKRKEGMTFSFYNDGTEIVTVKPDDSIYIKGKHVAMDQEVAEVFRTNLKN